MSRIGRWVKMGGAYLTPGGTTCYVCGACGESAHLHGVEYQKRKVICDGCGRINIYPWEAAYEYRSSLWEDDERHGMNDLISRAALLKECNRRQETDPMEDGRGWSDHFLNNAQEPSTEWLCVEAMIENMPAVDAVPVAHARWIGVEYDGYADGHPVYDLWECSACGEEHEGEYDTLSNYCPQCGARMDEREEK